jgi:hypothetical protein
MILGVFNNYHPKQDLFKEQYEPMFCIKHIKSKDSYLGYLAYALYNYISGGSGNVCDILTELINKYRNRIEVYLFYWHVLTKGKYVDKRKAFKLTEAFYNNSISLKFDDPISLYIVIYSVFIY